MAIEGAAEVVGIDGGLDSPAVPLPALPTPTVELRECDHGAVRLLVDRLGISPVLASILAARGISDPEQATRWLDCSGRVDAEAIGASRVGARLADAIGDDLTIAIHGDYDCDGVCSTAVLTLGLRALGASVIARVPEREDGYGLSIPAIDDLAASGAKVLVAVDCGITAVDEVAHACALGMEVLIVDHHLPRADGLLPDATLAHPNLEDPGALAMCATAVAAAVVGEAAARLGRTPPDCGIVELQGLATVTDMMPLEGANRAIVREGLRALAVTSRPGLSALLDSAGLDRGKLDARSLGFALGPRINAAGRVRAAGAALELLLTDDRARAEQLAAALEAANVERREIQRRTLIAAEGSLAGRDHEAGWVIAGQGWHPGVVGIVAGSIASRWHRPTVVLAVDGDEATGSARSVPGVDVAEVLAECSDLLLGHGGHSAAAGLTLRSDRIGEFTSRFAEAVHSRTGGEPPAPVLVADVAVAPSELTLELADELEAIEPTGQGNPPPRLLLRNVSCERPRRMGEGRHARFAVVGGTGSSSAVAFDTRERIGVAWGERADVAGRLEVNRFRGAVEPRLVVERADAARRPVLRSVGGDVEWIDLVRQAAAGSPVPSPGEPRRVRGSSGRNVLGLLSCLEASGSVALVAADSARRLEGLREAAASCDLFDWSLIECEPGLLRDYRHVVVVDPPWDVDLLALAESTGEGWIHHAWSDAEIRFTIKVHEAANDIEGRVRPFYAELREADGKGPEALLAALRGSGRRPRPPRQVAWMVAVLDEIGAAAVDLDSLSVIFGAPRMALEDSVLLGESKARLEEGRRFLAELNRPPR